MRVHPVESMIDMMFVERVWEHEQIFPYIHDDNTKQMEIDFSKVFSVGIFVIPRTDKEERMGFFFFNMVNSICFEAHSAILPEFRGKQAIAAGRLTTEWIFKNTPCRKIVTHVPLDNPKAYALAFRVGFRKEGTITKSFLRNDKLIDQYVMGLCKEEV